MNSGGEVVVVVVVVVVRTSSRRVLLVLVVAVKKNKSLLPSNVLVLWDFQCSDWKSVNKFDGQSLSTI